MQTITKSRWDKACLYYKEHAFKEAMVLVIYLEGYVVQLYFRKKGESEPDKTALKRGIRELEGEQHLIREQGKIFLMNTKNMALIQPLSSDYVKKMSSIIFKFPLHNSLCTFPSELLKIFNDLLLLVADNQHVILLWVIITNFMI